MRTRRWRRGTTCRQLIWQGSGSRRYRDVDQVGGLMLPGGSPFLSLCGGPSTILWDPVGGYMFLFCRATQASKHLSIDFIISGSTFVSYSTAFPAIHTLEHRLISQPNMLVFTWYHLASKISHDFMVQLCLITFIYIYIHIYIHIYICVCVCVIPS